MSGRIRLLLLLLAVFPTMGAEDRKPMHYTVVGNATGGYALTPVNLWSTPPILCVTIDWGHTPPLAGKYTVESYARKFGWQYVILVGSVSSQTLFVVRAYASYVRGHPSYTPYYFLQAPKKASKALRLINWWPKKWVDAGPGSQITMSLFSDYEAREFASGTPIVAARLGVEVPPDGQQPPGGRRLLAHSEKKVNWTALSDPVTTINVFFLVRPKGPAVLFWNKGPTQCLGGRSPLWTDCSQDLSSSYLHCNSTCSVQDTLCIAKLASAMRLRPREPCRYPGFIQAYWPVSGGCCNRRCQPIFVTPYYRVPCGP